MERTQQDWFSIFDHQRRVSVERLELLQKFEQFLLQLPDGAYTVEQQEAADERLKLGLACCTEKRQKKSRNRRH